MNPAIAKALDQATRRIMVFALFMAIMFISEGVTHARGIPTCSQPMDTRLVECVLDDR